MSDPYRLHTPENVVVQYDLAGVGSRFLAAAIDSLIQLTLIVLVVFAVSAAGGIAVASGALRGVGDLPVDSVAIWLVALLLVVNFLLLWGYYVAFELLWNGQTPGKRALGLRVLRENGYPLGFFDSLIRNLVRVVDFLPVYYGIGVLAMVIDGRWRRLGDLAAGTIVVKERSSLRATDLLPAPTLPGDHPADPETPPLAGVERLTHREYTLLREYLLRRERLNVGARAVLARELGTGLAARLGQEPPADEAAAEALLEQTVAAYRAYHTPGR
jgi:uncharacterized RDD family membrane protein YckC